jgi:hypothetical protein
MERTGFVLRSASQFTTRQTFKPIRTIDRVFASRCRILMSNRVTDLQSKIRIGEMESETAVVTESPLELIANNEFIRNQNQIFGLRPKVRAE